MSRQYVSRRNIFAAILVVAAVLLVGTFFEVGRREQSTDRWRPSRVGSSRLASLLGGNAEAGVCTGGVARTELFASG